MLLCGCLTCLLQGLQHIVARLAQGRLSVRSMTAVPLTGTSQTGLR